MSFLSSKPQGVMGSGSGGFSDSPEFDSVANRLSNQLFTLTTNISTVHRLLGMVGTKKDSHEIRDRVSSLTDDTRELCKSLGDDVKFLQSWTDVTPSQRFTQQKLSREFTSLLADFQSVQRLSAEKQRQFVIAAKSHLPGSTQLLSPGAEGPEFEYQQQQLLMQEQLPQSQRLEQLPRRSQVQQQETLDIVAQEEIDFQNSLIAERELEIQGIEQGISELNEIFRDLGTMVTEQGVLVDNIESNITNVADSTQQASAELTKASRYQKGTRNKSCCLLLILVVILAVVLLAVFLG
ncbi:t-SNARE [Lipomyces tetrasporus]|uniref:t-SNARE n=1 Tax=Lipomyces tetrasporus TaxID=54092 RepID=A0AAD7QWB8_9ASCO|nr:t-SNARE [Lipomyces tetrasporus]KAJ8102725.1 t-SNARE [Lipomyces tetrasporus]